MRQQACFLVHPLGHRGDILQRGAITHLRQRLARSGVAQFGLFTQREQRFLAAGLGTLAGDIEHFIRAQVGGRNAPGGGGEGTVAAGVSAQPGERNEYLARVTDMPPVTTQRQGSRSLEQLGSGVLLGERQGLSIAERPALQQFGEKRVHR
ncbi:hypothetical protein D3C78_1059280 [compost metagenome]